MRSNPRSFAPGLGEWSRMGNTGLPLEIWSPVLPYKKDELLMKALTINWYQNCQHHSDILSMVHPLYLFHCAFELNVSHIAWSRHQMEKKFRVTGPLCGDFTDLRRILLANATDAELWCFLDLRLNKRPVNNRDAGDLRRHRAHYNVTVMRYAGASLYAPTDLRLHISCRCPGAN